jgi:hypothetical protein
VGVLDRGGMRHTADHMSAPDTQAPGRKLGLTKRSCFSRFRASDMVLYRFVESNTLMETTGKIRRAIEWE